MKWLYLILLLGSVSFPLAWSFESRVTFYKKWKALFPAILITAILFLIWDEIFTQRGYWGFNNTYLTGYYLGSLPLEEVLFFIIIPYACVFIYACVGHFLPTTQPNIFSQKATILVALLILSVSFINIDKAYTFWNFLFSGLMLLWIGYKNPHWLSKFWVAYGYHLIPFFIVNGILTGSFIENPIVWYNNDENLGIRIFTIPVEDTIYSMLLLLTNITFFEYFNKRSAQ